MSRKKRPTKPAPEKPVRSKPDWAPAFLAGIAQTGNITRSCAAAGIDRSTFYDRRDGDDLFQRALRQAYCAAADLLEEEARRRAVEGVDRPALCRGELVYVWVDGAGKLTANEKGVRQVPLMLKHYSDRLLGDLLRAAKRKFRTHNVEHRHKGRVKVTVEDLSDAELTRIAKGDAAKVPDGKVSLPK